MRDFRGLITNSGHTNGDICNAPGHFRDQISGNEVTMVNAMTLDWIIPLATPTGDDRFDRKSGGFDGAGGFCDFCRVDKAFGGHGAWIEDEDTLEVQTRAALDRDHFSLLALRIGPRAYDGAF